MDILAIDQGTSSTRAIIYSCQGEVIASSQQVLKQYYPQPNWVEHDPEEIWQTTLMTLRAVINQAPHAEIIACGLTNQRETTLFWDKATGECLAPAIGWQDRRPSNNIELFYIALFFAGI